MKKSLSIRCYVTSPMMIHGADQNRVELRANAVKSAMRYWWRALHPDSASGETLYEQAVNIFGGTSGDSGKQSSFFLRVLHELDEDDFTRFNLLPHKQYGKSPKNGIRPGSEFIIKIVEQRSTGTDLYALLWLAGVLGGIGQRSRRGFGNFIPASEWTEVPATLQDVEKYLLRVRPDLTLHYDLDRYRLNVQFPEQKLLSIPYIKYIEQGSYCDDPVNLTTIVGRQTHEFKQLGGPIYDASMGSGRPRLASPVWVSILHDDDPIDVRPLVTTLNTCSPKKHNVDLRIQDDFIANVNDRTNE